MYRSLSRFLALLAALGLMTPPALGIPFSTTTSSSEAPLNTDASGVLVLESESPACDDPLLSEVGELARQRETIADRLIELGDEPEQAIVASNLLAEDDLAVFSAHPEMLQRAGAAGGGRARVAAQLISLDCEVEVARELAARLTPEDLVVLLNNPEMMQRAGGLGVSATAWIIGGLIVAGLILLAASSNSSGSVSIQ